MNILNILDQIEKVDGDIYERLNPRRAAMKEFFNVGKKVSLAAVPLALGSMFTKAYGQSTPSAVTDVLNFALSLEYLEYHFYNHALNATVPAPIPGGAPLTAITTIRNHEDAHVKLLAGALTPANARPVLVYDNFDYTAGGAFADVFTNYQTFLAVALAFEDTGVRAYKGQAGVLVGNDYLTVALQIHSVEARHASHLRQMVAANVTGASGLKPWISLGAGGVSNDTGIAAVDAVYGGATPENNTVQAGINITGISTGVTAKAAAECFDEPLTKSEVVAIANQFIKTGYKL
ncbi:hypothetical protein ACVWYN_001462 [Pedobacter sp. UYP24]